jgi:hypothetical protein
MKPAEKGMSQMRAKKRERPATTSEKMKRFWGQEFALSKAWRYLPIMPATT